MLKSNQRKGCLCPVCQNEHIRVLSPEVVLALELMNAEILAFASVDLLKQDPTISLRDLEIGLSQFEGNLLYPCKSCLPNDPEITTIH